MDLAELRVKPAVRRMVICLGVATFFVLAVSVAPSSAQQDSPSNETDCSYDYNKLIWQPPCSPCDFSYNGLIAGQGCTLCDFSYNGLIAGQGCTPCDFSYNGLIAGQGCTLCGNTYDDCAAYFFFSVANRFEEIADDKALQNVDDGEPMLQAIRTAARRLASPATVVPEPATTQPVPESGAASANPGTASVSALASTGSNETTPLAGLLMLGLGSFAIALSRTRRPV